METLMVKAGNGDHYEAELKILGTSYREDVDTGALPGHATSTLEVMLWEKMAVSVF